jgi:hypothetical protein
MKFRFHQRGQVLIIVFSSIFFGSAAVVVGSLVTGQSLETIMKNLKTIELQEPRRKRVESVLDRWQEHAEKFFEQRSKSRERLLDLLFRQEATEDDWRQEFALLSADSAEAEKMVLGAREELRATLTTDEWNRLFAVPE